MKDTLEKRLEYFFLYRHRHRGELRLAIDELQSMGHVVLIGGMLRDLAVLGNLRFQSDVDLVIAPHDEDELNRRIQHLNLTKNRFGGYSWPAGKWRVDVWVLRETWANVMGHVKVERFEDLVRTTFFDFDAIIYKIQSKELVHEAGYFTRMGRKVFGINLRPNPNPVGNAVRAFRYARRLGFRWSPELTEFVVETVEKVGWDELMYREEQSFGTRYIRALDIGAAEREMYESVLSRREEYFDLAPFTGEVQPLLPLD